MASLAILLIALGLLIYGAYRGISVLVLAPLTALLAVVFSPGIPVLASYTQVFMPAAARFIAQFFPLFLLGALFGKLMQTSGAADTLAQAIVQRLGARQAILSVVLACALLTYGGVSLFVVAFAAYPIAVSLFRQANIPKRLIPATIALGAFTFTMTALPGTPAIQNAIPMPYFGTTPFAAPGLGVLAAAVMFVLGQSWLQRRAKAAYTAGEGYGNHNDQLPASEQAATAGGKPGVMLAALPILTVLVLNYLLGEWLIPALQTDYLQSTQFGNTHIGAVKGVWAIVCSLSAACLLLLAISWQQRAQWRSQLEAGANSCLLPIFNTASLVGFGAVVAGLPAFEAIKATLDQFDGGNPLVSIALSVNLLAGITGSASGGMSIALDAMGAQFMAMAQATGTSPDLLHRVTAVATGGLDALPHNGAVITLLGICGLSHKESYPDIFMVAVLFPLVALGVLVGLGVWVGSF